MTYVTDEDTNKPIRVIKAFIAKIILPLMLGLFSAYGVTKLQEKVDSRSEIEYILSYSNSPISIESNLDKMVKLSYDDKPLPKLGFFKIVIVNRTEKNYDNFQFNFEINDFGKSKSSKVFHKVLEYPDAYHKGWIEWEDQSNDNLTLNMKVFNSDWDMKNLIVVKIFIEDAGIKPGLIIRSPKPGVALVPMTSIEKPWYYLGIQELITYLVNLLVLSLGLIVIYWIREKVLQARKRTFNSIIRFAIDSSEDELSKDDMKMLAAIAYEHARTTWFYIDNYPKYNAKAISEYRRSKVK